MGSKFTHPLGLRVCGEVTSRVGVSATEVHLTVTWLVIDLISPTTSMDLVVAGAEGPATAALVCAVGLTLAIAGPALADAITGTPGPDLIRGTPEDDIIHGLAGNDSIRGKPGDDLIVGEWNARACCLLRVAPASGRARDEATVLRGVSHTVCLKAPPRAVGRGRRKSCTSVTPPTYTRGGGVGGTRTRDEGL